MGSCFSDDDILGAPITKAPKNLTLPASVPSIPTRSSPPAPPLDEDALAKIRKIAAEFKVVEYLSGRLQNLCYTGDSLINITSRILEAVMEVERGETPDEKRRVEQLFGPDVKRGIEEEKLFFDQVRREFEQQKPKGSETRPASLSRIFYNVNNSLKKSGGSASEKNSFGVNATKNYNHQKYSEKEVDEIVQLEAIGEEIENLGRRVNFTFRGIEKESEQIKKFLADCFYEFEEDIVAFKYDLSEVEVMKIAEISRKACEFYDNGVYLLFLYFVRSIYNLEGQGAKVEDLERLMEDALNKITNKYPPGEGLAGDKKYIEPQLKRLEMKDKFAHQPQKLGSSDKKAELERIIVEKAEVASKNREPFEDLIKGACLNHCLSYKAGLKYNPSNPNPKAMTRIQEKMLFKGKDIPREARDSVGEVLEGEEETYQRCLKEQLADLSEVTFSISDMVRGKCVFLTVEDIVKAITETKNFIEEENARGAVRYRLIRVESRFTKEVPISDVTLKIAINEEIVAELQLTLQTNFAAYNFAHKVYELARSKVFSKVKITHNYYEEFRKDFVELIQRSIETEADTGANQQLLRLFFGLEDVSIMTLPEAFESVVRANASKLVEPKLSIDKSMEDLIMPIFAKRMGEWDRQLGTRINDVVAKGSHSELFRSTVMLFFLKDFDMSKEYYKLIGQQPENMTQYLSSVFGIQNPDHCSLQRTLWEYSKILALRYQQQSQLIKIEYFSVNHVMGAHSQQTLDSLLKFMQVFEEERNWKELKLYYDWFMSLASEMPEMKGKLLITNTKYLMAKLLVEFEEYEEAKPLFEEVKKTFKEKEQFQKVIECDLFLLALKFELSEGKNLKEFDKSYDNVMESGKVHGLKMEGRVYGEVEWRIAEKYWEKGDKDMKKKALDVHYRKAIRELTVSKNLGDLNKMVNKFWPLFDDYGLAPPEAKGNMKVFSLSIDSSYPYKMSKIPLLNFKKIELKPTMGKNIKCRNGSQSINTMPISVLKQLCSYNWPNLKSFTVTTKRSSNFDSDFCKVLSLANWPHLEHLHLNRDMIEAEGYLYLSQANWPKLRTLSVGTYFAELIPDKCCEYLSRGKWPQLTHLYLTNDSKTTEVGCKWLSKGKWPELTSLLLWSRDVNLDAMEMLSKGKWPKLKEIQINVYLDKETVLKSFIQKQLKLTYKNND